MKTFTFTCTEQMIQILKYCVEEAPLPNSTKLIVLSPLEQQLAAQVAAPAAEPEGQRSLVDVAVEKGLVVAKVKPVSPPAKRRGK